MRHRILVLIAALLMLGMPGFLRTAAAEVTRVIYSDCIVPEPGYEYCFEETSVVNDRETRSGRFVGISQTFVSYTLFYNGEVVKTGQDRSHVVAINDGPMAQVSRFSGRSTFTMIDPVTGETSDCVYTWVSVYANGDFRHEGDKAACE